jgi:hypothetical protein
MTSAAADPIDLDAAIIGYLAADPELASLAPDGVWYDTAPPGATAFVIVSQFDCVNEYVLGGRLWDRVVYLVKAVRQETEIANTARAAQRMYELLQDTRALSVTNYEIALVRRLERVRAMELDDITDLRWQHIGGQYEIIAAPLVSP